MSTDSGRPEAEVPSFGDLFDDPEAPDAAPAADAGEAPAPIQTPSKDEPQPGRTPSASPALEDEPEPGPAVVPPAADDAGDDDAVDVTDREPDDSGAIVVAAAATAGPWSGAPAPSSAPVPVREPEPFDVPRVASAAAPAVTGRLYRSAGAEGPSTQDAIPAIDPEWLAAREAEQPEAAAPPARPAAVQGGSGLTWTGVVVVVMLGTVLVGFADALINNSIGILTGLALLATSVYCALLVRPADIWAAVVIPPLAFLVTALTAGQLTLDSSGSLIIREGYMLVKTLAQSAPWIVGTTLVCLVIVLVRRSRARHA